MRLNQTLRSCLWRDAIITLESHSDIVLVGGACHHVQTHDVREHVGEIQDRAGIVFGLDIKIADTCDHAVDAKGDFPVKEVCGDVGSGKSGADDEIAFLMRLRDVCADQGSDKK